ncbi:hypothetical protein [Kiloniella sp. b19]|uniref:hypothetical protein n=1 Tax=Kiloniella sp. GXU_MW_B19 TaxID=3141326 RepID=UPI0031D31468
MLFTTLNDLEGCGLCEERWRRLLKSLGKEVGDGEPLAYSHILESNGIDDALWCLMALPGIYNDPVRLLACEFAEQALPYVPEGELRPKEAVMTARLYAQGRISAEALEVANIGAEFASQTSLCIAARFASMSAAWAAAGVMASTGRAIASFSALSASWTAAKAAAWVAERDAAWLGVDAGEMLKSAGPVAAAAARRKQKEIFKGWLNEMG